MVFGVPVMPGGSRNCPQLLRSLTGGGALAVPWCATETGIMTTRSSNCATCWRRLASGPSRQGAFVGEHSFSHSLGAGRPDAEDIAKAEEFAERILQLPEPPAEGRQPVEVNGLQPLQSTTSPRTGTVSPSTSSGQAESRRGLYELRALRPSVSHGLDSPGERRGNTAASAKMRRLRQGLPADARYYDSYNYLYHKEELELGFTRRAEPELFF